MPEIELYSAEVCPYAQRTRLLLSEKAIRFSLVEIDLKAKPLWFKDVSPYAKVPVLKRGEDLVWESAIINEFIEEAYPEPPMMPREPGRRAFARFWIDFSNVKFTPTWYKLLLAQGRDERTALAAELLDHFRFIENDAFAHSGAGPYWFGQGVSLVDVSFYPWFERIPAMTHYRGVALPAECRRLAAWAQAMSQRPAVKACAQPTAYYIEGYKRYAAGTEDGVTAREMRRA